jgi:uncharacterized protein YdhG (YjbR/CyaY superfamily)
LRGPGRKAKKPRTVDEYLAGLPRDQEAAMEKVRKAIRAAAPRSEECISYGVPAVRLDGKVLVGFGAASGHCTFFPMSGTITAAHAEDLSGYETSKGAIRFPSESPLPAALVRKLVGWRLAEMRVSGAGRRDVATGGGRRRREAGAFTAAGRQQQRR